MARAETMTAIGLNGFGGPEVLQPETRPVPTPAAEEILIKVAAAGVNRPDVLQRQGKYPAPKGAPDFPGLEVAGTVAALGPDVTRHRLGDRVTALLPGGGYAEYAVAHQSLALPVPHGLSDLEAASLPETFFTVWSNVFDSGRLKAGESFLVHGGTSGIGVTAIQMAKAFGARVIATAGSAAKCEACVRLGAELAINYREEDFVTAVKAATDGEGANLILDMVGGSYVSRNYEAASMDGRIVQIATLAGPRPEVDVSRLMQKRLVHTGSTLRPKPVAMKAAIAASLREHVWPLIDRRAIVPVIHETFGFRDASRAHAAMEQGDHIGKLMLRM
ncbi:MAG: NAD(P)H-quinone oxidoreductase [Beijerinckiaceae bacterium]|nr:NAD(P)H-quinone oxidoreductase [Beijerinckiaceae bacterium]